MRKRKRHVILPLDHPSPLLLRRMRRKHIRRERMRKRQLPLDHPSPDLLRRIRRKRMRMLICSAVLPVKSVRRQIRTLYYFRNLSQRRRSRLPCSSFLFLSPSLLPFSPSLIFLLCLCFGRLLSLSAGRWRKSRFAFPRTPAWQNSGSRPSRGRFP